MSKRKLFYLIESIVLIIVGILIAFSLLAPKMINILLGIAVLIMGAMLFAKSVWESPTKSLLVPMALLGACLIGTSIALFINKLNIVNLLVTIISIALCSIGAVLIISSIIQFAKKKTESGIVQIVFAIIFITLGLIFLLLDDALKYFWLIFGILMAIFGIYLLIVTLTKVAKSENRKVTTKKAVAKKK